MSTKKSKKRRRPEGVVELKVEGDGASNMATAMAQLLGTRLPKEKAPVLAKRRTAAMKQQREARQRAAAAKAARVAKLRKRQRFMKAPDVTYRSGLERTLRKIATRGVVGLMNAIKVHQREQEQLADKSHSRQTKGAAHLQDKFMSVLKESAAASIPDDSAVGAGATEWGVLRDDYMMGAKIKDWQRVEHERRTQGAAGRGFDEEEDSAWNAAGYDALGSDSEEDASASS